jgi:hypothetical protein
MNSSALYSCSGPGKPAAAGVAAGVRQRGAEEGSGGKVVVRLSGRAAERIRRISGATP